MTRIFVYFLLFGLLGCTAGNKTEETTSEDIVLEKVILGQWTNLSMQIQLGSVDSIVSVPEEQWESILNIKPILTTFNPDGTYDSKYTSLADTVLFTDSGKWEIKLDSLYLTSGDNTTSYKFQFEDPIGTFTGYLDWDNDGENNDLYTGRQRKN